MFVDNAFGNKFIIDVCDDKLLYKNENFVNEINFLYDLDIIKNKVDRSQIGRALTTVGLHPAHLLTLPSIRPLGEWIISRINLASKHLPKGGSNPKFTRAWTNRMFNGCEGRCHAHPSNVHGVAIFYMDVPPSSSDLVFIKHGKDNDVCADHPDDERKHITPVEGMLVIHDPLIPHAITMHHGETPRTCLIFEFVYT
jgi:hypothetical protein